MQKFIALIVILFFLYKLFQQKKSGKVSSQEFFFWLIFWLVSLILIIFLRYIDQFVSALGFSASGIELLLYLGVLVLFFLVFKLRLKFEKVEKNITEITRDIALNNTQSKK